MKAEQIGENTLTSSDYISAVAVDKQRQRNTKTENSDYIFYSKMISYNNVWLITVKNYYARRIIL